MLVDKYEFHKESDKFLGYIISKNSIFISDKKVESIQDWKSPAMQKYVQSFLVC
jgi:hypothetical protein